MPRGTLTLFLFGRADPVAALWQATRKAGLPTVSREKQDSSQGKGFAAEGDWIPIAKVSDFKVTALPACFLLLMRRGVVIVISGPGCRCVLSCPQGTVAVPLTVVYGSN